MSDLRLDHIVERRGSFARVLAMLTPVNRLRLDRLLQYSWMSRTCREIQRDYRSMSEHKVNFLPKLPVAPRYPCPFLTATDMQTYVLPLYRFGWGISHVSIDSHDTQPTLPATRFSKRIILPDTDIAGRFVKEITSIIIEPENVKVLLRQRKVGLILSSQHHPILEQSSQGAHSVVDVHTHTHAARAPPDRQNIDDPGTLIRNRPGITHRDIRFAILVERLMMDGGFIDSLAPVFYPQPTDIETVHNFRLLPPEVKDSSKK